MDDEINSTRAAECAIGTFLGLLAFTFVQHIVRALCE